MKVQPVGAERPASTRNRRSRGDTALPPRTARRARVSLVTVCLVAVLADGSGQAVLAQSTQSMDEDFRARVHEWTTKPEFLSPLVDHLPVADGIPSPKDVLGHHVGAPRELTYYADLLEYYRALSAASPRVSIMSAGRTDEDREMVVVAVASEETIRELERYRGYLEQLADPRQLSESDAVRVITEAKPIYHFMAGLHSGETGPPEMLMELAYRLAVEEGPLFDQIRDNVIVTMTPVAEPDGRDRYVDWYYRHLIDITDDRDRIGGPPYWGKYIFHDNNRDINYSQVTMRSVLDWYLDWHPPIMHDLHESVPFLYTFSGQAPQNPGLDPIVYGELPWFANFEMAQLTKYGMPGAWTHGFVDMWSPGYLGFMASNHNGLVRFYETFGNGGATTMMRHLKTEDNTPEQARTSREWYRPLPPYEEVEWSMRNNTNYSQTAALSALQLASSNPQVILENFYQKSRNAIADGQDNAPHGWVIPSGQRDMTRVTRMVNLLLLQGVEVGRTDGELTFTATRTDEKSALDADPGDDQPAPEDQTYPAGSYVIKRDQPYGRLAKIMLEKQEFPDDGLRTYDDTGWTLGLMQHADVHAIDDSAVLDVPVEPIGAVRDIGRVEGGDATYGHAVAHYGSTNMVTLRYRLGGLAVEAAETTFEAEGIEFPAGSLIITRPTNPSDAERLELAVESLGLTAAALTSRPDVPTHEVDLPRLAMFSTWGNTQEVGWVRHAFDQFEIPFDLIFKERIGEGDLRADYDVVLVPSQGRTGKGLVFDVDPRGGPLAYTKTERYQFLGDYGSSEDITGGMGIEGVLELQRFVEAGGVLVTLGAASYFPPEFGLTREINARRPGPGFYAPGPIVEAEILTPTHPIFYGYEKPDISVRYANGPLLQVPRRYRDDWVLMRFPGEVLSGHMRGTGQTDDLPAIVDVPRGDGRIVLFATNPCYRWQNHGEFTMLFNTILHYNDFDAAASTSDPTTESALQD